MKKYLTYVLRIALIIFVLAIALSPLFANLAELDSLGLTPQGYLPVALREGETPTPSVTPTPAGTSTPTPTSTSPSPANPRITFIEYNPPGDDVAGEYIEITNLGGTAQDITGWYIQPTTLLLADGSAAVLHDPFIFPTEILEPGETVRVWTKIGINNPPNYYWQAVTEIWLNNGDTARLRDDQFNLVDTCTYPGGGQNTTCD